MYGLNSTNYNNYLACSQNFDEELKSPSLYDMQQQQTQSDNIQRHNNPAQTQVSTSICSAPPPIVFLFFTLLMTSSATAMLCAAIMTDHWEHINWDREMLINIVNQTSNHRLNGKLEFMLDEKVARLPLKTGQGSDRTNDVFLVPMNGGIWTLCINLEEQEIRKLNEYGFPKVAHCENYLADTNPNKNQEDVRTDWQHSESQLPLRPHLRMQNLSISCSLVCLIILGSAALVGAFGICQRQISAVLVTGVMYLLAALFALFTLMIIHFKRQQGRPVVLDNDYDGTIDGLYAAKGTAKVAQSLLSARSFHTAWSLDLGWSGVVLCAFTSFLWIFLSKIMRFTPISQLLM